MVNCPKCGAAVREEKAFCHNCGAPMDAVMREHETPMPDFSATVLEPPRRVAPQPYAPPAAVTEFQTAGRETTHIQPPPASVALPSPMPAPPFGKRKSSRKIGFAFVILLLFLMFVVFVLALLLD